MTSHLIDIHYKKSDASGSEKDTFPTLASANIRKLTSQPTTDDDDRRLLF